MGDHSRRRSRSRSSSRSHDRHRYRDRSSSNHRSRRHHRSNRDRSEDRSRRRSDRSESRRRSHHRRTRSESHSHSPSRHESDGKGTTNALKQQLDSSTKKVESLQDSSQFLLPLKTITMPKKTFRFDDKGREINEFGEVVETAIIKPVATLAINQKKQQKSQVNPYLSTYSPSGSSKPKLKNRAILDPRIKTSLHDMRRKKEFNFIKEGTFLKRAEEMRAQEVRATISQATLAESVETKSVTEKKEEAETPIKDPTALPPPPHNPVPEMEWWDFDLLPEDICKAAKAGEYEEDVSFDMLSMDHCITKEVIEHPVIVERNKLPPPKPLPLMLTKKERKKQRRKNRAEREEEKRIKIQAGLLPKPEMKLNYRNFKQVLGAEATLKPTWADNLVREQIEKRKLAHQMRNEERKLTPQEAAEKRERKVIGSKTGELDACLFRIESLADKKHRFKVSVNAQQYHLVGRCLIVPSVRCVMVYVEGTKKAMRHYVKLLMHRIDWSERLPVENPEENDDSTPNSCTLLWQGTVKQFHFKEFIMKDCDSDVEARQEMAEKSLVQHWDSVVNYVPEMNRLLLVCEIQYLII